MSASVQATRPRRAALAIFRAALEAADPARAVLGHVRLSKQTLIAGVSPNAVRYRLSDFNRLWIVGAGKAAAPMAHALEDLLGDRVAGGCISVPEGSLLSPRGDRVETSGTQRVCVQQAAHPFPDRRSVAAGREIAGIARRCGRRDLLLCVISGGASALMALPAPGVTLAMKKRVTRLLQARGATIQEMNAVRKHLSAIKGGHLARAAFPATVLTLILSDVIGDRLDAIGSGPTVPDPTACGDATAVLQRYRIPLLPLTETPKPGDPAFRRVRNLIVGSNRESISAAAAKAAELGYHPIILSTTMDGETRDVARVHAAIAREMIAHQAKNQSRRVCFLSGGETTVTLRGNGLGGRNQEFVLAAFEALEGTRGVTIFSAGTDGRDGPTDAAGAIAESAVRIPPDTRRFLDENDSYRFFEREGGLIKTGSTGTNVMDVRILLIN